MLVYPLSSWGKVDHSGKVTMEQMLFPKRREGGGSREGDGYVLHTETVAGEFKVVLTREEPDMLNSLV